MTIAAGFNFSDGILLCADTKHTGGMALYEPKLFSSDYFIDGSSRAKSVFAIVGSVAYAKMAVEKCGEAIRRLKQWRLQDMTEAIEEVLINIHEKHIYPHPSRGFIGGPDFYLMVALWSSVDGLGSYKTTETSVTSFKVYDCLGSGEYLGHYLIRPLYDDRYSSLEKSVSVACMALQEIKSYDANCGGKSEFVALSSAGHISNVSWHEISQREEFAGAFQQYAGLLYERLCDLGLTEDQAIQKVEVFKDLVLRARVKHQKDREVRKVLSEISADLGQDCITQSTSRTSGLEP